MRLREPQLTRGWNEKRHAGNHGSGMEPGMRLRSVLVDGGRQINTLARCRLCS
jgi:hypothetical protein